MLIKWIRRKLFGLTEDEKRKEVIKNALMDSFETRPLVKNDDGTRVEDNKYVADLLANINTACEEGSKVEKPKTSLADWLKFGGSFAMAGASVLGSILSYKFAKDCVDSEKDGNIIPRNQISYGKLIDKPKL